MKKLSTLFLLISIGMIAPMVCFAQSWEDPQKFGWLVPVRYAKPFVAETESPLTKVEIGYGRAREEYTPMLKGKKYNPYLNVSLGVTIPIWSRRLSDQWMIGVDLPISFHLWLDLKTKSAPVLDTDYRFAVGQVKALYLFEGKRWLRNLSFRFAPFNHESTHIGDELTIRRKEAGFPLTRVNVSYEYSELAVCLNDPNGTRRNNQAFKAGLMVRIPSGSSWFKIYPNEGDSIFNSKMKNLFEYYFEYEYQRSSGFLTKSNITNVLSIEIRNRARYHYPVIYWDSKYKDWYMHETRHTRAWCYNVYYGWKFYPKHNWYPNSIGFYAHAYYGIVPYGQFRNTPNYSYIGFSVVVEQ